MLKPGTDIYCGLFDSSILRQNVIKSQDRLVKNFEIELFHQNSGVSHVNSEVYKVRRGMILVAKPGQIRYSDFPVKCSFIRIDPQNADPHIANVLSTMPTCVYLEDNEEIEKLRGKPIDAAFLPLDPRLGEEYWRGFDAFVRLLEPRRIFPMHMVDDYDIIRRMRENPIAWPYKNRIMNISESNREFEF